MPGIAIIITMDSQFTTLIINGGIEYPIRTTILNAIPYFANNTDNVIDFVTPFKIGFKHINIIAKMMVGTVLSPEDISSHYDVMIVLRLANFLEIHNDVVSTGFYNWTENKDWVNLSGTKYIYSVYKLNSELVDFRAFFRLHPEPLRALLKATKLIYSHSDPVEYINILLFIKNYNFDMCFDGHDDVSRDRILILNKMRDAMAEMFLIDPYSEIMCGYFRYTPSYCDVWDCTGISIIPKPELDAETIVPLETAHERLRKFTFGLLDAPLNASCTTPFPHNNVIVAGGSISKILTAAYDINKARQSDVDIFIYATTHDERTRVFSELLDWFKTYNVEFGTTRTYYAIRGSVVTIYIKDIERKFQIISSNAATVADILGKFDTTHIQWCFMNGKFYGTPGACKALREHVSVLDCISRLRVDRMIKTLFNGYDIQHRIIDDMDITELICPIVDEATGIASHSAQLKKYIRDMHGFWYPRTDENMDAADYLEYILCQIEKDSHAAIVTDHPTVVMQNVTIGGNFERDYNSISFATFNPRHIVHGRIKRFGKSMVTSAYGIIHLSTPPMNIARVIHTDVGIEITLRVTDPEFIAFCADIEGPVCRTYGYASANNRIIVNNETSFIVAPYKINRQDRTGISLMRSQNGAPLNIEEDLQPGDEIQVIFIIECDAKYQRTTVMLIPVRVIKTVVHATDVMLTLADTVEELKNVEFDAEIEYGELDI